MTPIHELIPNAEDLLALEPEELALGQSDAFIKPFFNSHSGSTAVLNPEKSA